MNGARRTVLAGMGALALLRPALARERRTVRIGVLSSFSGEYADGAGGGSVVAARLAAIDGPGIAVEFLQADMQDKPDVGAAVAREWFDREGVHAVLDVPNSAVAAAVATVARERNRVALLSGAGLATLSGAGCGPNHVQWTYDTGALARVAGRAVVAEGGDSWFFLTADYSFGRGLAADTGRVVREEGGRVLGSTLFPFPNTTDFSAFLLEAANSGAAVLGLACSGNNLNNAIKQAAEFGLTRPRAGRTGTRLAAPLCLETSIRAVGLADCAGLLLASPFGWNMNEDTLAFSARFRPLFKDQPPTMVQAGAYSALRHYLRALDTLPPGAENDGAAVVARMKGVPALDPLLGAGIVRASGSVAHDMHLFQVKSPAESTGPWDFCRRIRTVPAAEAFGAPSPECRT